MQVNIVVTNRFVTLPVVFEHERFLVESLSLSGMYHVIARYGYNEKVQQDAAFVRGMLEHTVILLYQFLKMSIGASEDLEPVLAQGPISLSTLVAAGRLLHSCNFAIAAPRLQVYLERQQLLLSCSCTSATDATSMHFYVDEVQQLQTAFLGADLRW